jgi:hypothetical protein
MLGVQSRAQSPVAHFPKDTSPYHTKTPPSTHPQKYLSTWVVWWRLRVEYVELELRVIRLLVPPNTSNVPCREDNIYFLSRTRTPGYPNATPYSRRDKQHQQAKGHRRYKSRVQRNAIFAPPFFGVHHPPGTRSFVRTSPPPASTNLCESTTTARTQLLWIS